MDIVFIRHGKTEFNQNGIFGGSSDINLSREGINQAREAANFTKDVNFSKVYISPLKRAIDTSRELNISGEIDPRLREMDFGIFEGLNFSEILKLYPMEAELWSKDYINYKIPKGESLREVYERVADFINEVSKEDGTTLVITHEGVIKCALCTVFNNMEHFFRFKAEHCRFTQICADKEYKYIKAVNAAEIY
ncbi:MAG: histidine phosphatase family protein [Solirubrobacterales bacterium]